MLRRIMFLLVLALGICLGLPVASGADAKAKDTDGDGISDEHEAMLGMPVDKANVLKVIAESPPFPEKRRTAKYDATKDVLSLEYCHVGKDRHVWRVSFVEKPRLKDTVLHLYIDADANTKTGRKDVGCEYMVTTAGGRSYTNAFSPDGKYIRGPKQSVLVVGKTVLISNDLKLSCTEKGFKYAIRVLCHTIPPKGQRAPAMSDGVSVQVKEWPATEGPVPERPKK